LKSKCADESSLWRNLLVVVVYRRFPATTTKEKLVYYIGEEVSAERRMLLWYFALLVKYVSTSQQRSLNANAKTDCSAKSLRRR
jgi:hypothetical protein